MKIFQLLSNDRAWNSKAKQNWTGLYISQHTEIGITFNTTQIPVNAFFPAPLDEPAGITFKTLNLTVLERGLIKCTNKDNQSDIYKYNHYIKS
jgi:hypothetical protein